MAELCVTRPQEYGSCLKEPEEKAKKTSELSVRRASQTTKSWLKRTIPMECWPRGNPMENWPKGPGFVWIKTPMKGCSMKDRKQRGGSQNTTCGNGSDVGQVVGIAEYEQHEACQAEQAQQTKGKYGAPDGEKPCGLIHPHAENACAR